MPNKQVNKQAKKKPKPTQQNNPMTKVSVEVTLLNGLWM